MNDSLKKIKNFVRKHKETMIVSTAVAVPLIVLNVKYFQANRVWAARNGCHDANNHLHLTDDVFERIINGARWVFSFDNKKVDSEGVMIMTSETYAKEWNVAKNFLRKHGLLEEFYKKP